MLARKNLYTGYHAACHVAKFRKVNSMTPKVIGAHSLNITPIFGPIVKKCLKIR